jgi:hypothetical protein
MSAILYGSGINLAKSEIQNAKVQNLGSAPGSPVNGQIYYDTTLNQLGCYHNGSWVYLSVAGTGDVTQTANSGSANRLKVSAGLNKTIIDFASAGGIIKVDTNGVVSISVSGTDYVIPSGIAAGLLTGISFATTTDVVAGDTILQGIGKLQGKFTGYAASTKVFTNTTIDANGTGNVISNLETADFAASVIDNDSAMTANSSTRIATQQATKAAIAAAVSGVAKPMGGIDCSTNPNYPAANAGEFYRVTVAGLIGGGSGVAVTVGDVLHCFTTAIAGTHASVGASWTIVQNNVDAATTSTLGLVTLATQAEAEAKSVTTKAVTPQDLTNFPIKKIATIGDGSTVNLVVSDNLGTIDKIAQCRDAATNTLIMVDIVYASNTTTFKFDVAPASNAYKVVIIG